MDTPPPREATDERRVLAALGERLRTLRMRRGVTQGDLARRSGVSLRYIAQMEGGLGNVSVLLLRRVAAALGVAPEELVADGAERAPDRALLDGLLDRLAPDELVAARALLSQRFARTPDPGRTGRIALIGLRGAGKSTLGAALAAQRGVPFVELDREVERDARMDLPDIFETHGQDGFRRFERAALERLVAAGRPTVIAAGGGIVAAPATFALLLESCRTIWLRASPEEHMARVMRQGDTRPMRDNRRAMEDLRAILAAREMLYARADAVLDTAGCSPAQSLAALAALVG